PGLSCRNRTPGASPARSIDVPGPTRLGSPADDDGGGFHVHRVELHHHRAQRHVPSEGMPMSVIEILAQIEAPHFTAGIVLGNDLVVEAAPKVRFLKRMTRDEVRRAVERRGWKVSVVYQMERRDL